MALFGACLRSRNTRPIKGVRMNRAAGQYVEMESFAPTDQTDRMTEKEASMATMVATTRKNAPKKGLPRATAARVEEILAGSYAFMDSPVFKNRSIEKELFSFDEEPKLPLTSWYQPTREDL